MVVTRFSITFGALDHALQWLCFCITYRFMTLIVRHYLCTQEMWHPSLMSPRFSSQMVALCPVYPPSFTNTEQFLTPDLTFTNSLTWTWPSSFLWHTLNLSKKKWHGLDLRKFYDMDLTFIISLTWTWPSQILWHGLDLHNFSDMDLTFKRILTWTWPSHILWHGLDLHKFSDMDLSVTNSLTWT